MTDRAYQTMSFIALMDTLYTDDDRITNNMRLSDKVLYNNEAIDRLCEKKSENLPFSLIFQLFLFNY